MTKRHNKYIEITYKSLYMETSKTWKPFLNYWTTQVSNSISVIVPDVPVNSPVLTLIYIDHMSTIPLKYIYLVKTYFREMDFYIIYQVKCSCMNKSSPLLSISLQQYCFPDNYFLFPATYVLCYGRVVYRRSRMFILVWQFNALSGMNPICVYCLYIHSIE